MGTERLSGIDRGTLLAEHMLGSRKTLRALLAGGPSKDIVLQEITATLEKDPVGQACFLRIIFSNLAREGGLEVTNRRDRALAILTDTAEDGTVRLNETLTPFVQSNAPLVYEAYINGIQQQKRENDPFSGSINTLLDVGKAIAPCVLTGSQERQQVADAWERVAEQFPTLNERFHIRSRIEEIKNRISPVAQLDRDVEPLRQQGLTNPQIAQQLGRKVQDIANSARRLIADGRIEPAPKGKPISQATIQLDSQVEQLRKQRLSNSQIAERLGRKVQDIANSAHRLIADGRIERAKSGPKPKNLNS